MQPTVKNGELMRVLAYAQSNCRGDMSEAIHHLEDLCRGIHSDDAIEILILELGIIAEATASYATEFTAACLQHIAKLQSREDDRPQLPNDRILSSMRSQILH